MRFRLPSTAEIFSSANGYFKCKYLYGPRALCCLLFWHFQIPQLYFCCKDGLFADEKNKGQWLVMQKWCYYCSKIPLLPTHKAVIPYYFNIKTYTFVEIMHPWVVMKKSNNKKRETSYLRSLLDRINGSSGKNVKCIYLSFQKHSVAALNDHLVHFAGLVFTFNTTAITILHSFNCVLTFWVSPNLEI